MNRFPNSGRRKKVLYATAGGAMLRCPLCDTGPLNSFEQLEQHKGSKKCLKNQRGNKNMWVDDGDWDTWGNNTPKPIVYGWGDEKNDVEVIWPWDPKVCDVCGILREAKDFTPDYSVDHLGRGDGLCGDSWNCFRCTSRVCPGMSDHGYRCKPCDKSCDCGGTKVNYKAHWQAMWYLGFERDVFGHVTRKKTCRYTAAGRICMRGTTCPFYHE